MVEVEKKKLREVGYDTFSALYNGSNRRVRCTLSDSYRVLPNVWHQSITSAAALSLRFCITKLMPINAGGV